MPCVYGDGRTVPHRVQPSTNSVAPLLPRSSLGRSRTARPPQNRPSSPCTYPTTLPSLVCVSPIHTVHWEPSCPCSLALGVEVAALRRVGDPPALSREPSGMK